MSIVKTAATHQAMTTNPDRRVANEHSLRGESSFRAIMRGKASDVAADMAPLPCDVGSSAQSAFNTQTLIGNSTARFDGRAIVAPVYERQGQTSGNDPASPPVEQARIVTQSSNESALELLVQSAVARMMSGLAPNTAAHANTTSAVPALLRISSAENISQMAPSMVRPAKSFTSAVGSFASVRTTSPARPAQNVRLAASVVTLADEVRITIRGATLSPEDEALIARTVSDLLAQTSLGDRPIRIVAVQRK